jgi:hypothetical protein
MALSRHIAERWPTIGVVIASGMVRPRGKELAPGTVFFPKPYNFKNLADAVMVLAA